MGGKGANWVWVGVDANQPNNWEEGGGLFVIAFLFATVGVTWRAEKRELEGPAKMGTMGFRTNGPGAGRTKECGTKEYLVLCEDITSRGIKSARKSSYHSIA